MFMNEDIVENSSDSQELLVSQEVQNPRYYSFVQPLKYKNFEE